MQIKLQKVGNSVGTTFPQEILDQLGFKEGDALTLVVMDDGIKLKAYDPAFEQAMAAYQQGALQYHEAMKELADG